MMDAKYILFVVDANIACLLLISFVLMCQLNELYESVQGSACMMTCDSQMFSCVLAWGHNNALLSLSSGRPVLQ